MPTRASLPLACLLALVACGGEDEPIEIKPVVARTTEAERARLAIDAFAAAPTYSGLVEVLAQPHARIRALLGPHQLQYRASFYTGPDPAEIPLDQPLPDVRVDEPILERFAVEDQLDLRWLASPGAAPHFALSQRGGGPESARELIVIDKRVWSSIDDRGWFERELDGEVWQLWLDDAQRAACDALRFAGPRLELGPVSPVNQAGRSALRVALHRSDTDHPERVVEGPTPWRSDASIDAISGELVIDRETGAWLAATFALEWSFEDSAGREVRGSMKLEGRVDVLADTDEQRATLKPPQDAQPLPERDRPELLRERLLDGLAAP